MTRRLDGQAIAMFVLLDLATYALLYWLVLPAFEPVLATLDTVMVAAIGHVLTAVRLTFIGAIAVRSIRARRGFEQRGDVVPTVVVAALIGFSLQLVLGAAVMAYLGLSPFSWAILLSFVEWIAFALLGAMFVNPGEPDATIPRRYRVAADGESGSISLFLVPAIAGILAAAVLVIVVLGSATNDRRESVTAADAAALAAGQAWRDGLEDTFDDAVDAADDGNAAAFWDLAGRPLSFGNPQAAMEAAARSYAARNNAELLDLDVDWPRGKVTAFVRSLDEVPESGTRIESRATSELVFVSGLCRSGSTLGFLLGGTCLGAAPEPEPTPEPTETLEPPADPSVPVDPDAEPVEPVEPPFTVPDTLGGFDMDVVLTR